MDDARGAPLRSLHDVLVGAALGILDGGLLLVVVFEDARVDGRIFGLSELVRSRAGAP